MTRYLTSEFFQGAKSNQLVDKFNNAVETLDQSKLIEISSDGRSIKFFLEYYEQTGW